LLDNGLIRTPLSMQIRELERHHAIDIALLNQAPTERMSEAARECAWTYDDADYKWDSACGESWVFNDDGPAENNARFCQGCGGKIKIAGRKAEIERSGGSDGH